MSGTSMDGIDAALVCLSSSQPQLIATYGHSYPDYLQQQLADAVKLDDPITADLAELNHAVGETFADAANELLTRAGIKSREIAAIGSHGQTIRHAPNAPRPYSLQIGAPEVIAARTGIDVIADFRRADIEAGGQGAPLVPAFHKAVFSSTAENRVIINIGGIANITVLPADPTLPITGFDTGPGNTLMDQWINEHLGSSMDYDGQWAAGGIVDNSLLARLLSEPYFSLAPPKSSGRELFNLQWLSIYLQKRDISPQDVQVTLCEFTAQSIADAIRNHAANTQRLLVCGGGAHNRELIRRLENELNIRAVESTLAYGIDPDWVEAVAFAWLAKQALEGKPGNIPEVTGACYPVILGQVYRH
jgi:anhydro-N-acetylmuramic acid kinase